MHAWCEACMPPIKKYSVVLCYAIEMESYWSGLIVIKKRGEYKIIAYVKVTPRTLEALPIYIVDT